MALNIQERVENVNKLLSQEVEGRTLTKKVLAVGIEINQRYLEYLDELLNADLSVSAGVTVDVGGDKIHFKNQKDFEEWLADGQQ